MRKIKMADYIYRLDSTFVYDMVKAFGADALDTFIGDYLKADTNFAINTPMVKRHFDTLVEERLQESLLHNIFSNDGVIRYSVCYKGKDGGGISEILCLIRKKELIHRMSKRLSKDDVAKLNEIAIEHHESFVNVIVRLDISRHYYDTRWFVPAISHDTVPEFIYDKVFAATSRAVHENSAYGFSFSPTLYLAYAGIHEPRNKRGGGRGRPRERALMMHMCPKGTMPKRLILRPINDLSEPPKFFCRVCKERLTKAHKTYHRLHKLQKKVT